MINLQQLCASESIGRSTNYLIEVVLRKISQAKQIKNINKQKKTHNQRFVIKFMVISRCFRKLWLTYVFNP